MEKTSGNNMPTLFDDLQEGLLQAITYAQGGGSAQVFTTNIDLMTFIDKDQPWKIPDQTETE